jgi:hypothetical protein
MLAGSSVQISCSFLCQITESLVNEISLRLLFGRFGAECGKEILSPAGRGAQPDSQGCVDA